MSYEFLFTCFFITAAHSPRWPQAFSIFSPPLQNFHVVLSAKNVSLVFYLSCLLSVALFSRWSSLACRLLSLFPRLSLSLISKFVDITTNISLILETTRIQKQFPLSVFVFIDSLVVSASQDAGGYAISRQINLELHLGCHTCWLSYFTLVWLWCGRTAGGRADGQVITKIYQMGRLAFS